MFRIQVIQNLETILNNIFIKSILASYISYYKIQDSTGKKSPYNGIDSCDLYIIVTKYISDRCSNRTKDGCLFCSFLQNNPPTKGQKKLHSRPPKANRFRKKMISGGLIVSKMTITPNANVTSVLIFPTFLL